MRSVDRVPLGGSVMSGTDLFAGRVLSRAVVYGTWLRDQVQMW